VLHFRLLDHDYNSRLGHSGKAVGLNGWRGRRYYDIIREMPTSLLVSTLPMPDDELVAAIRQLVERIPGIQPGALEWRVLEGNDLNSTRIEEMGKCELLADILRQSGEVLRWAQLQFQVPGQPDKGSIAFARQDTGIVNVSLNLPDAFNGEPQVKTQVAIAFYQVFRKHARSNILDEIHPLLSEFYSRREEVLVRLEELQARLLSEFAARHQEIEEAMRKEYAEGEQDLAERRKQFDDRDHTHVRRALRDELRKTFEELTQAPWPTPAMERKRRPVKLAFACLIAICSALLAWAGYRMSQPLEGEPFWFPFARLALSLVVLAAGLMLYIRWQDWRSTADAREEERLKQLGVDFNWANWLVEVMLEWRAASGGDIPRELLERLTDRAGAREMALKARVDAR